MEKRGKKSSEYKHPLIQAGSMLIACIAFASFLIYAVTTLGVGYKSDKPVEAASPNSAEYGTTDKIKDTGDLYFIGGESTDGGRFNLMFSDGDTTITVPYSKGVKTDIHKSTLTISAYDATTNIVTLSVKNRSKK